MVVTISIQAGAAWRQLQALVDSGATYNFISQLAVKELDLDGSPPTHSRICTLDGNALHTYLMHSVAFSIVDGAGEAHQLTQDLIGADIRGYDVILGMPWLKEQNPNIDFASNTWRPREAPESKSKPTIALLDGPAFGQVAAAERSHVYAAFVTDYTPAPAGSAHAMATIDVAIPPEYQDYKPVFSKAAAEALPPHGPQDHAIDLEGGHPKHGPVYPLSANELKVLRDYIDENLQRGFIRPSTSPAGAPILFVKKKDGSLRLCVDYRNLNKLTIKNRHPLPLISEALDRLVNAKIYTKLDIRSAYNLIRIREGDEWKTAFRTRYGHFEYLVMPFGLANAPATFQAYINHALRDCLDVFCIAYLDDILIFSDTKAEHVRHVSEVLERLLRHGLYVKLEKCEFHVFRIGFVGFMVYPNGTGMEESRVADVRSWPTPRSHRDVQAFLGFANFYRRFIYKFSNKAQPLTDLLKGGKAGKYKTPFLLTDAAAAAFQRLKDAFLTAPLLRHYDPTRPIQVETDASGFALAGVLRQPGDDPKQAHWHPVAFYSRKMTPAERNYGTGDAEMLAIVTAFKCWRHYLEGASQAITVISDHDNLRSFMTTKELSRRHARWWERLSAFNFTITYRAGRLNPADPPSRRPDYEAADDEGAAGPNWKSLLRDTQDHTGLTPTSRSDGGEPAGSATLAGTSVDEHFVPRALVAAAATGETAFADPTLRFRDVVVNMQQGDSLAQEVREQEAPSSLEDDQGDTTPVRPRAEQLRKGGYSADRDGVVWCRGKLYLPERGGCRLEAMKRHHDDPLAGHFGHVRTLELIKRKYYWPQMAKDVRDYVVTCTACQRIKPARHKPHGELQSLPLPRGPWSDITMDFITDLPPSKKRTKAYDSILVVVDRYTKMARYIPVKKTLTAAELADVFMSKIHRHYGQPSSIVTDRGSVFTAKFWQSFTHYLKIRRKLSTAFHPQTDGQTERQNQTLEQYLRAYTNYQQDDWVALLPQAEFAYNNSRNSTTGLTPFMALMGYNPSTEMADDEPTHDVPAVTQRISDLRRTRATLESTWKAAVKSQAVYYNKRTKARTYNVGDMVYLRSKNIRTSRPNKKLDLKNLGPFAVTDVIGTQAYRLRLPPTMRIHPVFHVSLLEPAHTRPGGGTEPPPPVVVEDHEEWEVEDILDSRLHRGQLEYLVKWLGFDDSENRWVTADDIAGAPELLQSFHKKNPTCARPGLQGPIKSSRKHC